MDEEKLENKMARVITSYVHFLETRKMDRDYSEKEEEYRKIFRRLLRNPHGKSLLFDQIFGVIKGLMSRQNLVNQAKISGNRAKILQTKLILWSLLSIALSSSIFSQQDYKQLYDPNYAYDQLYGNGRSHGRGRRARASAPTPAKFTKKYRLLVDKILKPVNDKFLKEQHDILKQKIGKYDLAEDNLAYDIAGFLFSKRSRQPRKSRRTRKSRSRQPRKSRFRQPRKSRSRRPRKSRSRRTRKSRSRRPKKSRRKPCRSPKKSRCKPRRSRK